MTELILELIHDYKDFAVFIVFFIAFFESMVVLGLFLPGWLLLVGIGTLIGADLLSFYPIVISAYFGAVLGEYLSYYLGFHYHKYILNLSLFKNSQKQIKLSQLFFQKHGITGVFLGRFFGPTRALVPFLAGLSEMPKKTFFWVNSLSGLLWAPLYLIPGILIGAAFKLEQEDRNHLILMIMIVVITLSLAIKFIKSYLEASKAKNRFLPLVKMTLSISSCFLVILLFVTTPQWRLFLDILVVLWSKL